jgi:uncharacterized protein YndB with AHSA1/START domain
MPDILHRIGIRSSSTEAVYQALTTTKGLSGWWTTDTKGEPGKIDGLVQFRFGKNGFDMKVLELHPESHVLWQVLAGPEEWIGTILSFEFRKDNDYIILLMKHLGWKEPAEFMHHCSTKWAIFLMSLKSMLETGKGGPFPNDLKIDNWN